MKYYKNIRQWLLNAGYPVYQVAMMTDEEVVQEYEEIREELGEQRNKAQSGLFNCNMCHQRVSEQNQLYKQALEFYADKNNYEEFYDLMRNRRVKMILEDGGRKAREAVEESE